jgi:hypothetical protein
LIIESITDAGTINIGTILIVAKPLDHMFQMPPILTLPTLHIAFIRLNLQTTNHASFITNINILLRWERFVFLCFEIYFIKEGSWGATGLTYELA